MALIQCAAAACAGVEELVYHTFNMEGTRGFEEGARAWKELVGEGEVEIEEFLGKVEQKGYRWGMSDGN